ncbi:MAG TPA: PAS domain S-box protein [Burkholderiales bacterium]|nr:PAS domain S-box protein [Burkholderiales bacterium]
MSVAPVRESQDQSVQVARLQAELAAARAEVESLQTLLKEQAVRSRRIEESRQAWAQTVDALAQPMFMHDNKGCIVRANRAYAERAGVPVKNLIGRVYWKLFPIQNAPFPVPESDAAPHEFELPLSEAEVFLVRSAGPSAGLPQGWRLYIFQDVTELKKAVSAVRASGHYARSIVDSSLAAIVAVDRDRRILEFNPAAERAFGYTREEVIGRPANLLYADPESAEAIRRLVFERQGGVSEVENRRKNGEVFTSLMSAAILRDADGKALGILGTSIDVTERKRAEAKMREVATELELLFENAVTGIAFTRELTIERVNRRFAELFGYPKEEFLGQTLERVHAGKEDYERTLRDAEAHFNQNRVYRADVQLQRKDGSPVWIHVVARAVARERDAAGAIWVFEDVTERKFAELRLERRETYFRALIENCSDVIAVIDAGAVIKYESRGIERLAGYSSAERTGRSALELVHPDDAQRVRAAYQRIVQGEGQYAAIEFRMHRKDGSWRTVEGIGSGAFDLDGEKVGVVNLHDVTERRHAEHRLVKGMEGAVAAIAAAAELRDPYTAGHERRVADLAAAIGREMGLPEERVRGLHLAGVVHDIGTIHVPAEILVKPSRLSALEQAMVRTHCQAGHDVLKNIDFPWPIARIVLQHHELIDGSGYPLGLKGDEILLEARILSVADVVEAMVSHRPYRPAVTIDAALSEIVMNRGTHYDARVVDACLKLFREKNYLLPAA